VAGRQEQEKPQANPQRVGLHEERALRELVIDACWMPEQFVVSDESLLLGRQYVYVW
jgi:hypothetical protein